MSRRKQKKIIFQNTLALPIVSFIVLVVLAFSSFGAAGVFGESILKVIHLIVGETGHIFILVTSALYLYWHFFVKNEISIYKKISIALGMLSLLILSSHISTGLGGLVGNFFSDLFISILSRNFAAITLVLVLFASISPFVDYKRVWNWAMVHDEKDDEEYEDYDDEDEDEYGDEGDLTDEEEELLEDFDDSDEQEYEEEEESENEEYEEEEYDDEDDAKEEVSKSPSPTAKISAKEISRTEAGEKKSRRVDSIKNYKLPSVKFLSKDGENAKGGNVKAVANDIKRTLKNFKIDVDICEVTVGPTVTKYAFRPAESVRLSKIVSLKNNLELALAASPIRIEAPIPGKSLVGIEVPNKTVSMVGLGSILSNSIFKESERPLNVAIGKNTEGKTRIASISKMPHLLVAGATGSGKSVFIHNIIMSLLMRNKPDEVNFILIDPKRVELSLYKDIPHLLCDVIKEPKPAITALSWAVEEMERRYEVLENYGVRDLTTYRKNFEKIKSKNEDAEVLPYIVIVIDELADIMQTYPRELEGLIVRIAQKARAVGIHLILSTQRPSVNVITGVIKANIPTRVALQVSSQIDSRTIIDGVGAESLVGNGDLLLLTGDMQKPERIQSSFVSDGEIKKVVEFIKKQSPKPLFEIDFSVDKGTNNGGGSADDELYEEAKELVMSSKKASTSYLQRKLKIGYSRAARLIDMLEENGIVTTVGSRREVVEE